MLDPGTLVAVRLPEKEGEVEAKVIRCSAQGRSCDLQLIDTGETVHVNINKCKFTVLGNLVAGQAIEENNADASHDEDSEHGDGLDAFKLVGVAASKLDALSKVLSKDPAIALQRSIEISGIIRGATKELFDYAAVQSQPESASMPQVLGGTSVAMHVDGFDPEQIWLQLDMLSAPALKRARKLLRKAEGTERLVPEDVEEAIDELLEGQQLSSDSDVDDEDEHGDASEDDVDYDAMLEAGEGLHGEMFGSEDADSEMPEPDDEDPKLQTNDTKRRRMTAAQARAAVEDDFMKLDEMEAFLDDAERMAVLGSEEESEEEYDEDDLDDAPIAVRKKQRTLNTAEGDSGTDLDDGAFELEDDEEGSDEDDELGAVLNHAAGLIGRKAAHKLDKKKKKKKVNGFTDSEEEAGEELGEDRLANATYEDFFGPRKLNGPAQKFKAKAKPAQLPEVASDDEDLEIDEEEEEEEEEEGLGGEHQWELRGSEDEEEMMKERPSSHQRRLERTAAKVAALEAEAMNEKPWWMQGEVISGARPLNSALEVDLDFETTVKPPPAPTEEATASLEDLIKARVGEERFDDPVKIAPLAPEKKKLTVELDDKKATAGLGELYERDYVAAVTGTARDRDEPVRELARAQWTSLAAMLDALSHGSYRPAPSIEEVTVKVDVPALMMEEAAPVHVSTASLRAPEETYKPGSVVAEGAVVRQAGGGFKTEAELTREDRKRRRATKKRAGKKHKAEAEAERAARALARGEPIISGRKSEANAEALRKLAKASKKPQRVASQGGLPTAVANYSKSAAVFAKIQADRDMPRGAQKREEPGRAGRAANFKL